MEENYKCGQISLTFDLTVWPFTLICFEIIVLFISNLFTKFNRYWPCLAKVIGGKLIFRDLSLWPLTSNLTFDPYCHTNLFLFSFWPSLPSFIDNWHFRQKLWMKGYYFEYLSIDLWPLTHIMKAICLSFPVYSSYQISLQLHTLFRSFAWKFKFLEKLPWPLTFTFDLLPLLILYRYWPRRSWNITFRWTAKRVIFSQGVIFSRSAQRWGKI